MKGRIMNKIIKVLKAISKSEYLVDIIDNVKNTKQPSLRQLILDLTKRVIGIESDVSGLKTDVANIKDVLERNNLR
jgi:flagellar biosynthesis/type III secretory pathway protein FliH